MCAAKSSSRPTLQRVAKHLYRRGNSYEFFRRIPPDARHLFGDIKTKSESFGDVSLREAEHLAAELRKLTDKLIAEARKQPDPTARATSRHPLNLPRTDEIDRAVRAWVLEQEARITPGIAPEDAKQIVRDMTLIADLTALILREVRIPSRYLPTTHTWLGNLS